MATQPESDKEVIGSFQTEFDFHWREPEKRLRDYVSGKFVYGTGSRPIRHGPSAIDSRHPFYSVLRKQADEAAVVVKMVEDYLNQPDRFVVPTRVSAGALDKHERALAIVRLAGKWRIAVYSWTFYAGISNATGDYRPRFTRQRRKTWLECGLLDKVWTIKTLPKLLDTLMHQVEEVASRARENDTDKALDRLVTALKTIPAR